MIKEPGNYWAFDEECRSQVIEILGNGTCLVFGVVDPIPENSFVYIALDKIEHPKFEDYDTQVTDCPTCRHLNIGFELCEHPSGSSCSAGTWDKWQGAPEK